MTRSFFFSSCLIAYALALINPQKFFLKTHSEFSPITFKQECNIKIAKEVPEVPDVQPLARVGSVEPPRNITKEMSESLEWFHGLLMSFIHERHFDELYFSASAPKMATNLGDIVALGSGIHQKNPLISHKLDFVSLVYEKMLFASRALKYYRYSHHGESFVVCDMIDLNIRLFGLYNSQGVLDTARDGYAGQILHFQKMVSRLVERFQELDSAKGRMGDFFEAQTYQAKERVLDLLSQVPKKGEIAI
ncbi:hypothetical protein JCM33374_g6276 [Metschnikowia sp. JCM 33374]|nr:hypothetical protein JCM33374_g6276 [Metschnikowia sp. JCM 33374]